MRPRCGRCRPLSSHFRRCVFSCDPSKQKYHGQGNYTPFSRLHTLLTYGHTYFSATTSIRFLFNLHKSMKIYVILHNTERLYLYNIYNAFISCIRLIHIKRLKVFAFIKLHKNVPLFAQLFNDISQRFLTDANKLYLLIRNTFTIIHQVAAFLVMMRLNISQQFRRRIHVVFVAFGLLTRSHCLYNRI